jgi:hypothetical protein
MSPSQILAAKPATSSKLAPSGSGAVLTRSLRAESGAVVRRVCKACEDESLRRAPVPGATSTQAGVAASAPPIVHDVLRSPGQPLDADTRAFMEPRFGRDFGRVRVHTESRATDSARAVSALAYTVGHHIVFDEHFFRPSVASGRRLLAHELAHTVQQGDAPSTADVAIPIGAVDDGAEQEAHAITERVVSSSAGPDAGLSSGVARRQVSLARSAAPVDCSTLNYRTCTTGVYKCGYGGSGTCGWTGMNGGCRCVGAAKPTLQAVLAVLAVLGLSLLIAASVVAALADPEPATKLALIGLTAEEIDALMALVGAGAAAG